MKSHFEQIFNLKLQIISNFMITYSVFSLQVIAIISRSDASLVSV